VESSDSRKPEDLLLSAFNKKQRMSRGPVPIIPRPPFGTGRQSLQAEIGTPSGRGFAEFALERSEGLSMARTFFRLSSVRQLGEPWRHAHFTRAPSGLPSGFAGLGLSYPGRWPITAKITPVLFLLPAANPFRWRDAAPHRGRR